MSATETKYTQDPDQACFLATAEWRMHEGGYDICCSDHRFVVRFEHVNSVAHFREYMPGYLSKRWAGPKGVRHIARMATSRFRLNPAAVEVVLAEWGC